MNNLITIINSMSTSDKIATVALIFAIISYIPSFIALKKSSHKIKISISDFNIHYFANNKEFVIELLIRNVRNMPITIYEITLAHNKRKYFFDSRVAHNIYLSENDVTKVRVPIYVPLGTPESKIKLTLKTSAKTFKATLRTPYSDNSDNNASDTNSD